MKLNFLIKAIAVSALFVSCVDPLDVNTEDEVFLLTVEGFITTDPGPHRFRLSKSAKYGSIFEAFPARILGADIAIREAEGDIVYLEELGEGNYQTPVGWAPEVGGTYSLLIKTPDGKEYTSFPQKINKAPELDSIVYEYTEFPSGQGLPTSGFTAYTIYEDNGETNDFYLFSNMGRYELDTRPDLHTILVQGTAVPAPKDCCYICFAEEVPYNNLVVADDRINNGDRVIQEIGFIEDDGLRFENRSYLLESQILSLNKEAYAYLSLLDNQLGIDGDIFDPPPAQIRGNIVNIDDADEEVIGFFWAADISTDSLYLEPSRLENKKPKRVIQDDCREVEGATTTFPNWW